MQPPLARRDDDADPYAWLRHPSPEVTAYLAAERAYYDDRSATVAPAAASIVAELRARTPDAERSVSWDHGPYAYYRVTPPGRGQCGSALVVVRAFRREVFGHLGRWVTEPGVGVSVVIAT
ncbi:MAG: hypothetical protein ACKOFP_11790, partial [Actinomycetota bacterium]